MAGKTAVTPKVKKVLGWEATVTFEEGIKRTIKDYQKVIL